MRWALPLLLLLTTRAAAHDLRHKVTHEGAIVVELFYADERPFSYEGYEIYQPGEDLPFQVGRSDALGRIVFMPDRAGDWRLKAFAEDGHGAEFTITSEGAGRLSDADKPLIERYARVFAGLGLLMGVFGIWSLFKRRRG